MLRTRSLEERVEGLVLEVKRLKARLAAEAGQADLLSVLLSDDKGDVSFVDDLREKLRSALSLIYCFISPAPTFTFVVSRLDLLSSK